MVTVADVVRWIALESEDYDAYGGSKGNGFARATTDDVAAGLGISPEEAYKLLKAAARKGLVHQDKERRKGVSTGRFGASQVGWAIWEVHLDDEQTAEHERRELKPNASGLEWVKGDGVDRDGHNLTWWKNKAAKWSKSIHDRPKVFIQVRCWDRTGASTRDWPQFEPGELKEAKAYAKEFIEKTGGTCQVEGRVEIPYQNGVTIELGEWKNAGSDGFYVWSVDKTGTPFTRRGPFRDLDEAVTIAKQAAKAGSTYDEGVTFGSDPEASDFEIVKAFKAWSAEVHHSSDLPSIGVRLKEYRANAGSYYVWALRSLASTPLTSEGPWGPMTLEKASQFARIGATEGAHDRAVSFGKDPEAKSFRIERRYAARSGLRLI